MVFAPEDKRAWRDSEIMAEFEKQAMEMDLLNGGPPEAFEPIPEKTAEQDSWEDEDVQEPEKETDTAKLAELASHGARLMDAIEKMANDLAKAGRVKAAYRLERALAALKDIAAGGE